MNNQSNKEIEIRTPKGEFVGIDKEIASEVQHLWDLGVETIESCSGHGKDRGCIIVSESSSEKMLELGYEKEKNTGQWHSFYPKTS